LVFKTRRSRVALTELDVAHKPIREAIDYFFSLASPWSYLGHEPFVGLMRHHGLAINFKPVFLPAIFEHTGGLVLPKRHPARQRYRLIELQRWREQRGVALNLMPKHVPFDTKIGDRTVLAVAMTGHDPAAFIALAFKGIWVHDLDLGDRAVIAGLLGRAGLDPTAIQQAAETDFVEQAYEQNAADAIAAGVIGGPSYVRRGEVFWGQDRLALLESAIVSGRAPFTPPRQ
jgi:2-hydroxychromene-2-carboxylate isomerase